MALVAAVVVQRGDALKPLRVLALTRYGTLGASSRLRFFQYFSALEATDIQVRLQPLFSDAELQSRYQYGHYRFSTVLAAFGRRIKSMLARHAFDLIWIEKEALPWWPLWFESALLRGVPYVLDYDDAVFHTYDLHRLALVRQLYRKRLDGLMAHAGLLVCGNDYLAQRALHAGAKWVEKLPTVIDLERYTLADTSVRKDVGRVADVPRIVWIGSPSTAKYLQLLRQPLQTLAKRAPFVLRVIGSQLELTGVQVECVPWTESTEVAAIAECDVGVMPLLDSAWERGKCGYKLIQYMACALPVVASNVGVNAEIVHEGGNGYLARSEEEWLDALTRLLTDATLRQTLGQAGRHRVEMMYSIQKTGPVMAHWLREAAEKK